MGGQIQNQEKLLEDMIKRQHDYFRVVDDIGFQRGSKNEEVDTALGKLHEAFHRYRSDMLGLVREQDTMSKSMEDVLKHIKKMAYAIESTDQNLADVSERLKKQEKTVQDHYEQALKQAKSFSDLDERSKKQEKTVQDHYAHSLKQAQSFADFDERYKKQEKAVSDHHELSLKHAEEFPKELAETNRNVAKLHVETEKNLGKMHSDTQKQLERMQQDTMRRLLAFDGIESALQTLLIRTEPPEKKPFILIRIFKKIFRFFRVVIPSAFRKIRFGRKGRKDKKDSKNNKE